ncbi:MAG: adenylosuccinate synthase, partial [Bacteroidetes bacterium]|nr:adenylosuccinate synthase [Bacteroidota bacterium]
MKADVILGLQWGDEGKGKIVDYFAPRYHVIARFQGGPNAGHTICFKGQKYVLHLIPSGIFHRDIINVIGNGVVIDPVSISEELEQIHQVDRTAAQRLLVSDRAHLILPSHRLLDAAMEAGKGLTKIGSTLKGIGPAYTDKTARCGLRVGDIFRPGFMDKYEALKASHLALIDQSPVEHVIGKDDFVTYEKKWMDALDALKQLKVINAAYFINSRLKSGKKVLAEGAQGTLLDIDFGSYPFVTSSNTSA